MPNPPNKGKNNWCFTLGRQPLLSAAEITAVFEREKIKVEAGETPTSLRGASPPDGGRATKQSPVPHYLILRTDTDINPSALIKRLGGTVKISEAMSLRGSPDLVGTTRSNPPAIADFLNQHIPSGKINFSISGDIAKNFGLAIKKELKNLDRSARYYEPKNTATIIFNNLIDKGADLTVVGDEIFITRAVQPIEELGARDYGRPGRDDRSGMLPPKLAMIMINLAQAPPDAVILDPFCGSGTILTEALLMGYENLIGADISKQATDDCKKNINWLAKQYPIFNIQYLNIKILNINARQISTQLPAHSIDAVITEPYLGEPLRGGETEKKLRARAEELKKLYLAAFEQFAKILKPNGAVVFVFPKFKYRDGWIGIDLTRELKKIGFAERPLLPTHPALFYARPGQRVGREIHGFAFKPNVCG